MIMFDYHSAVIKQRMSRYLKSPDFDDYFAKLHLSAPGLWATGIIAPFTVVGLPLARAAWRKIRTGDARTKRLRNRYHQLAENGEVIFTYVIVANSDLKYREGASAPALVAANFKDGKDDLKIMEMRDRFADAALGVSEDQELSGLLGDLDYTFGRRRCIPPQFTEGVEVTAFDLQIIGDYLPTRKLQIEAIPCIAEPGQTGLICMIPFKLIEDVITEIERSIATN